MNARDAVATPVAATTARTPLVFAVIAAGVAMSNLDTFVVNVALPPIAHDLDASLSSASWVLNAYAVVFAALLIPAGGLADRYGARGVYLSGLLVFSAASAACALAPGVWWLVGLRAAQAVGAALLIPSSLGLLIASAPPERRIAYIRAWTAISGVAAAIGPALGGLLTQVSWQWVFLINVPIGVAALSAARRLLPAAPRRETSGALDLIGAVLLTVAIAALTLGVVQSSAWGWGSARVIGALVGGMLLLGLLALQSTRHPRSVLPPGLLKIPVFATASTANLLFALPFAAMLLSTVLWTQQVWDYSPVLTGLAIAPGPLMVPAFALGAGPALMRRAGARGLTIGGCAVFAVGIAWWIAAMEPESHYAVAMLPGMLLTGIGVGLILPTLIGVGVSSVPPASFSTGSGVITMTRQLGSVLGVAILVAILGAGDGDPLGAFRAGWWFTIVAVALTALASVRLPGPVARPSGAS